MARKGCGSGCLRMIIMLIVVLGLLSVGVYFGGNYLLSKYFGDEGELYPIGINSWEELFEMLGNLQKLFSADEPEVNNSAKPSQDKLDSANGKIEQSIENYGEDSVFGGGLVFNGKLILTGGEMASLLDDQLKNIDSADLGFDFSVYAVSLDSKGDEVATFPEYTQYEECEITIILALNSAFVKDAINNSGFPMAPLLSSMIADGNVYITLVNGYVSEEGEAVLKEGFQSQIYLNEGGGLNDQILNLLLTVTGQSQEQLSETVSGGIIALFNNIGSVTFGKAEGESVIVFDNKYNSELVTRLNIFGGVDIAGDYPVAEEQLNAIKQEIGNIRVYVANNALDESVYIQVEAAADAVVAQWDAFTTAYGVSPNNNTSGLQSAIDALKTTLGI